MTRALTKPFADTSADRILDAAFALLCTRGFSGTSISAVEDASGLPASSIYHFFGSKRGLCAAVVEREATRWLARLDRASALDTDPHVTIRHHLRNVARLLDEEPEFLRLLILLSLEQNTMGEETLGTIRDVRRHASTFLGTVFARYLEASGRFDSPVPDRLGRLTLAFIEGLFLEKSVDRDFRLQRYVDAIAVGVDAILVASSTSDLLDFETGDAAPMPDQKP